MGLNSAGIEIISKMVVMNRLTYDTLKSSYQEYLNLSELKESNLIDLNHLFSFSIFLLDVAFHSFSTNEHKKDILDQFLISCFVDQNKLDIDVESNRSQLIELLKQYRSFTSPCRKFFLSFINRQDNEPNPFSDYVLREIFKTDSIITKIFFDRVIAINLENLRSYVIEELNPIS